MALIYEDDQLTWTGWVLRADQLITRRKRFNFLMSPEGVTKQVYRSITPMIDYMCDRQIDEVLVLGQTTAYLARFQNLQNSTDPKNLNILSLKNQKELNNHG